MADELPDEVLEAGDASDEFPHGVDLGPEGLELAHLQQVVHVLDVLDHRLLQVFLSQEGLAADEVGVGQVGEGLQQHANNHLV